jgi:type IV secretion system protein VirB9
MFKPHPILLAVVAIGLTASVAHAAPDRRIQSRLYVPDQVVRLRGWVGYHIDLQFEPGEVFQMLGGGDLAGLTYGAFANHLVLKPKAPTVRTNLTVFTTRRTYVLDYAVLAGQPEVGDEILYSLRFLYPPTPEAAGTRASDEIEKASADRYQNTDYWYCGNPLLQPVEASDDGVHTRLRFGPSAEVPAIFVRNDDGSESLLNFSIQGADVVIHRLARHFILRRGGLTGCIANHGFIGSGERLDSGTVSPHLHRESSEKTP